MAKLQMIFFTWVLWSPIFDAVAELRDYACSTDINKLLKHQNCAATLVGNRQFSTLSRSLIKEEDWNTSCEFVITFL